eukprot:gene14339-10241_t
MLLSALPRGGREIGGRSRTHSPSNVPPALLCLIWKARAKKFDMGFSVKETVKESGQPPAVLEVPLKCSMEMPIQGRIAPDPYHRTVTLHFDNSLSALQSKTVVFWVAIGENVV